LPTRGALYIVRNWEQARQIVETYDARCKEAVSMQGMDLLSPSAAAKRQPQEST
jgi:hypothetical protein